MGKRAGGRLAPLLLLIPSKYRQLRPKFGHIALVLGGVTPPYGPDSQRVPPACPQLRQFWTFSPL